MNVDSMYKWEWQIARKIQTILYVSLKWLYVKVLKFYCKAWYYEDESSLGNGTWNDIKIFIFSWVSEEVITLGITPYFISIIMYSFEKLYFTFKMKNIRDERMHNVLGLVKNFAIHPLCFLPYRTSLLITRWIKSYLCILFVFHVSMPFTLRLDCVFHAVTIRIKNVKYHFFYFCSR